jgi:transcriptional regulator with XRE-family HTH domain
MARRMSVAEIAAASGLHRRTVERIRAGVRPRTETRRKLTLVAVGFARSELLSLRGEAPYDERGCLAAYLGCEEEC